MTSETISIRLAPQLLSLRAQLIICSLALTANIWKAQTKRLIRVATGTNGAGAAGTGKNQGTPSGPAKPEPAPSELPWDPPVGSLPVPSADVPLIVSAEKIL